MFQTQITDLENTCRKILAYRPGTDDLPAGKELNPEWEALAGQLSDPAHFRYIVFSLAADLPAPVREYLQIMSITGEAANIDKSSRPWLYETSLPVLRKAYETEQNMTEDPSEASKGLTEEECARLESLLLGAYYMDYRYQEAEETAGRLMDRLPHAPWQAYYNLIAFYSITRRYDTADELAAEAMQLFNDAGSYALNSLKAQQDKNTDYRAKAEAGKKEYIPNPREEKEAAQKAYFDFLQSIGIDASAPVPAKKPVAKIPRDQYPSLMEIRDPDFDTYVAFDVETTGTNPKVDSIIEIGAIRVVKGRIEETADFIFQETARPYKKRLSQEISKLTGITMDDLKDSREMWEVFASFMDFVGEDVLVGYNCMAFDSRFLARAGRYAGIIIRNPFFDVMRYATSFADLVQGQSKPALKDIADSLDITNPQAHRALSDAITTARVFEALKSRGEGAKQEIDLDDLLADLDEW